MLKKTIALTIVTMFLINIVVVLAANTNYYAVGKGSKAIIEESSGVLKTRFIANTNTQVDIYTNGSYHSTKSLTNGNSETINFTNKPNLVELEIKTGGDSTLAWFSYAEYGDGSTEYFSTPSLPPSEPDPPPIKKNSCGNPKWDNEIKNWVDNIFCPIITFLDLAKQKLDETSTMIGQGLDINKYFRIFGDLPTSWQLVVSSLLLMITTLSGLLIFRSAMRLYYAIKEGVKWW